MRRWGPYLVLGGAWLGLVLLLEPWSFKTPLNDDWAYLLPAKRLAETGILRLTDWGSPSLVLHVAWGALWTLLFGWDPGLLRLLTMGLLLAACALLLRLLREEGARDGAALAAALCLLLDPLALLWSASFMTDVPYLAWLLAALYATARGLRRRSTAWLAAGSALAGGAYLIRQLGLLLPAAATAALLARGRPRRAELAAAWLPALLAAAAHLAWLYGSHGLTWANEAYMLGETAARLGRPAALAGETLFRLGAAAGALGLFALPLAAALLPPPRLSPRARGALAVLAAGSALLYGLRGPWPWLGNSLNPYGLGPAFLWGRELKAAGVFGEPLFRHGAAWLAVLGACAAAALLARPPKGPGAALLGASAALHLAASMAPAYFTDRYLLPVLPGLLACLALSARRLRPVVAAAALAGLGLVSWAGTADYLSWNRALWRAGEAAAELGVAPQRLAGGFEWDAWWGYEEAMAALRARKEARRIAVWDWHAREREAMLSFVPEGQEPGMRLAASLAYRTPLSREPQAIHLLLAPSSARTP